MNKDKEIVVKETVSSTFKSTDISNAINEIVATNDSKGITSNGIKFKKFITKIVLF